MSDYRFQVAQKWAEVNGQHINLEHFLHVMIDGPEMAEARIPLDDIKAVAFRSDFQSILDIIEKAQNALKEHESIESDLGGIFLNAFDDITTICQSQLDKGYK